MIRCFLRGIGVQAPGLAGWPVCRDVLAGARAYRPEPLATPMPEILPANERRRASASVRLALSVAQEAAAMSAIPASAFATVFTSSDGDPAILDQLCETLAQSPREMSPIRFHNSVHNAAAGYWSIATGSRLPATSVCAFDGSFAAGLIEAGVQVGEERTPVLLVAADLEIPPLLYPLRPIDTAFAVALALSHDRAEGAIARCEVAIVPGGAPAFGTGSRLQGLFANPAGRSLPLLQTLARGAPGTVLVEYSESHSVAIRVEPCWVSGGLA